MIGLGIFDDQAIGADQRLLARQRLPDVLETLLLVKVSLTRGCGLQARFIEQVTDLPQFRIDELIKLSVGDDFFISPSAMVIPERVGVVPLADRPLMLRNDVSAQTVDGGPIHDKLPANAAP